MDRHQDIVARGFRIVGWALGAPSLVLLLFFCVGLIDLSHGPASDTSRPLDIGTYGIVALLSYGMRGIAALFEAAGAVTTWAMVLLAVLSLVTTSFAVVMYVTGRGIARHATWARVIASLISIGFLLLWFGVLAVLPGDWIFVACMAIAVSFYTLWVMTWRFG